MGQAAKRYGEAPREREQNGRKLKEIRLKLGLTAKQSAELLQLNNTSAIVNCETACSSEMLATRLKQYAELKDQLAAGTKRTSTPKSTKVNESVESLKSTPSNAFEAEQEERYRLGDHSGSARLNMRTKNMLEIAVRRLAKVEKTSEVDIWLNLIDLCAQQDSR